MIERTLAKRYAAALLKITDQDGSTEETEALLLALKEAYLRDKGLRAVLSQPRVSRAAKKRFLRKPFEGKVKRSFLEFLDLVVDKNRTDIIPEMADVFDRLADASQGIVRVNVKSWRPLSEAHKAGLTARLIRLTGKKIALDAETDAALKGGMQVRVGDTIIDGSLAYRLKVIGERLKELERR